MDGVNRVTGFDLHKQAFIDQQKVSKLQARIRMICRRYGEILEIAACADDAKFVRLQNDLVNHAEQLFVFVLHPEVEATWRQYECSGKSIKTAGTLHPR